jgi:hypothetical protein
VAYIDVSGNCKKCFRLGYLFSNEMILLMVWNKQQQQQTHAIIHLIHLDLKGDIVFG